MPRAALVIWSSRAQDAGVERVIAGLRRRGVRVLPVDSATLPLSAELSWGPDPSQARLRCADGEAELAAIDAVWLRHTHVARAVWDLLDPDYAEPIRAQMASGLWDLLRCLPQALHVDPLDRLQRVPAQVGMLRLARACGLQVPRTLVSNSPDDVAAFLDSLPGAAIRKMIDSSASKVPLARGPGYLPTVRVSPEDRAALQRVALCPMVFQEEVPKAVELRITAVGRRLFTAAVDARGSAKGEVDWRQDPVVVGRFQPWELDAGAAAGVHALLDAVGLQSATVDMVVRPDGEHVFLELNTVSYFDFVEEAAGLPISDALADLLAGEAPPRAGRGPWA